ncbi:39S ribosomal protein L46, mitochondrial [Larimichthys crocea]|uniref:Large ribosomal subunit protein mL46 n=2 Tax=Larimichthys crocea TaxID=215358 RepID=A0A6G0J1H2_LARCR|nr:39S ribosomal protein L46, mitochondrial [Larimichthys crocea]
MQQKKMSASCGRMASRGLVRFVSRVSSSGLRPLSSTSVCRATLQNKHVTDKATSPWTLMAAVCLQRLPVISSDLSPIEQQFKHMLSQMELEKSMLSDHELRLLEDKERMSRKQANDYDSDDEDGRGDQDIVLTQDLEDSWEQKFKSFQPAPRVRADVDENLTSPERCLADSLLLLVEQQVGGQKMWLLPQTQWQEGETLRQTAERALSSLSGAGFKATFLGNAPCGVYKYKLPKAIRTESSVGTKVFFFKAILSDSSRPAAPTSPFLWVTKGELQRYLKPAYMAKVDRFIPQV